MFLSNNTHSNMQTVFVIALTAYYIQQCVSTQSLSCNDSAIYYLSEFKNHYDFDGGDLPTGYYYLTNITFIDDGIFDYVSFDKCDEMTTYEGITPIQIYDENFNRLQGHSTPGTNCHGKEEALMQNKLYHIILGVQIELFDPNKILKIIVRCRCDYKCRTQQQISCGDSMFKYGDQFNYGLTIFNDNQEFKTYQFNNITFIYKDGIYDYIQFTTCNNVSTLEPIGLAVFDDQFNEIQRIVPVDDCVSLTTSLLQQNKLYHISIRSRFYRGDKKVKMDVICHCDCNYFLPKNNLAYKDIAIYDIVNVTFNIKTLSACDPDNICNVFHLSSSRYNSLPKLSVDGRNNNFIIELSTNYKMSNIFYINRSLDIDDQYHKIEIMFSNDALLFTYDNINYFNMTSANYFYHSKYQMNQNKYDLYVASPWHEPLNATIERIYIHSLVSDEYYTELSTNFILITKLLNWNNAMLFCQNSFNASLAIIQTVEEIHEIINLRNNISQALKYSDVWIGFTDQDENGAFIWFGCDQQNQLCNTDLFLDSRWFKMHEPSCGYLVGGNNDPDFAFRDANCDHVSNAFVCDRRYPGHLFFTNFELERSETSCNYYYNATTNDTSDSIFDDLWLGTEVEISFDIKINSSCIYDRCVLFYLQNENNFFALLYVDNRNYVHIEISTDITVESFDTQFNINHINNGHYHRIDILLSETKQLLNVNRKTYFIAYRDLTFNMNSLKYEKYELVIHELDDDEIIFNVSISNICVNSNMIRNNNIWYKLGNIEDHNDDYIDSVFNYKSIHSYPIFYYQNITIIVYDDFIWLKYIHFNEYYQILRQQRSYPYYTQGMSDIYEPMSVKCANKIVSHECTLGPMKINSQQFLQESLHTDIFSGGKNESDDFEIGYVISSDDNGVSYLTTFDLSTTRVIEIDSDSAGYAGNQGNYLINGPSHIENWILPNVSTFYAEHTCISSNKTHLFLINQGIIIVDITEYFTVELSQWYKFMNESDGYVVDDNGHVIDERSLWEQREEYLEDLKAKLIFTTSSVSSNIFNLSNVGCSINDQYDAIYIFGGLFNGLVASTNVYKYHILNDSIQLIEKTKLKSASYNLRAIKAHNNAIYIYGGMSIDNNTQRQIFNIDNESFNEKLIEDGDNPFTTATFNNDHKVLLKYNNKHSQIEYFIPELVSIDFTSMKTTRWRYSGFSLSYIFLDYNYYIDQYNVIWKLPFNERLSYFDVETQIVMSEELWITVDDCQWCSIMTSRVNFDSRNILCEPCIYSEDTTSILTSVIGSSDTLSIDSDITILPSSKLFEFSFYKCEMVFWFSPNTITITANSTESISVSVEPSSNCKDNPINSHYHTYPKEEYVVLVSDSIAEINHYIFIDTEPLLSDGVLKCRVCDHVNACNDCRDPGIVTKCSIDTCNVNKIELTVSVPVFHQRYDAHGNETGWGNDSRIQDLVVRKQKHNISVKIVKPGTKTITTKEWYQKYIVTIILIAIIIAVIIVVILFYFGWKQRKLKQEIKSQREHEQIISNPLVLVVGIEFYNEYCDNRATYDIYLQDLNGIDVDVRNIQKWCELYNYDLYPKELKLEWTQNEIIQFLRSGAKKAAEGTYDSIIFISSCHGYENNILTSDYHFISKDAVHRLFSINYPSLREIPRIFCFDCCDGVSERSGYRKGEDHAQLLESGKNITVDDIIFTSDKQKTASNVNDAGKNIDVNNVLFNQDLDEIQLWCSDERNPDYKSIIIHGANLGFQSKLSSIDGSYLIREFVISMMDNASAQNDDKRFFGDIMDSIQETLHERGKQQIVNTFHNFTRYLKFAINQDKRQLKDEKILEPFDEKNDENEGSTQQLKNNSDQMQCDNISLLSGDTLSIDDLGKKITTGINNEQCDEYHDQEENNDQQENNHLDALQLSSGNNDMNQVITLKKNDNDVGSDSEQP
eukprot:484356_1